jgi:hypothetical protein
MWQSSAANEEGLRNHRESSASIIAIRAGTACVQTCDSPNLIPAVTNRREGVSGAVPLARKAPLPL